MFFYLLSVAGLGLGWYFYGKQVKNAFLILRYELVYWILGGIAVGDDILYFWKNKIKEYPDRNGDVAIVTGGSRGIGLEIVKKLLHCGMHVVIACRNVEAGQKSIELIRKSGILRGTTDVINLDTSSLASVRSFAEQFLSRNKRLHLLINNAGIMFVPHSLSEDGVENHLATNYLGHCLLTHLLLPALIRTGQQDGMKSRVVNVSSCAHVPGSIHFEDINFTKSLYVASQAYAQSKLAQIMFTRYFDRKMRENSFPVGFYSVHPGVVNTELFDGTLMMTVAPYIPKLFFKRPDQGAISILYAALSPELEKESGCYVANCRKLWVSSVAKNKQEQERLMRLTMDLLKTPEFLENCYV